MIHTHQQTSSVSGEFHRREPCERAPSGPPLVEHTVNTPNHMHVNKPYNTSNHTQADSRMACFVFSSLSSQAPSYLADDIYLVSEGPRRRLRSSTNRSCAVPRTHNTFGDRSFAVAGPCVWNSLPANLRDEDITYMSFRRELKTYWFSCGRGAM